jgi:hypothetical protein
MTAAIPLSPLERTSRPHFDFVPVGVTSVLGTGHDCGLFFAAADGSMTKKTSYPVRATGDAGSSELTVAR